MMKLNPAATITEEFCERIKSENRSAKMMKLAPLIVLACLVVVFLIVCGASFLSPKNIMNILNQMGPAPGSGPGTDLCHYAGQH